MHSSELPPGIAAEIPTVPIQLEAGATRHDVIRRLAGVDNIGIELGVAGGGFSERMVASGKFRHFFGVDLYGDSIHTTAQYKEALRRTGLLSGYKLLRMRFDEALELFDDGFFDFIYIDGFAHTGQEGGETLVQWFRKLKVGGVMAGDDYHPDWPLVQWAVNEFARELGAPLHVTDVLGEERYSRYPSWFVLKEQDKQGIRLSQRLAAMGKAEGDRVHRARAATPGMLRRTAGRALDALGMKSAVKSMLRRKTAAGGR